MHQEDKSKAVFFLFFFSVFFYRSSSALHRRSSTEILSRPLGYLLLWGPQCLTFVSDSSRIRTHVMDIAMRTCYCCSTLAPPLYCIYRQETLKKLTYDQKETISQNMIPELIKILPGALHHVCFKCKSLSNTLQCAPSRD